MTEKEIRDLVNEFTYDFEREKDAQHKALLIQDFAKKLSPETEPGQLPLPKNIYVTSGIIPEYFFQITMPMHMVNVQFLNSKNKPIGDEYKSFPYINRAIIEVEGIPSFLIKKAIYNDLDWNSVEHAKVTLYVYDAGKLIFDIDTWHMKHLYAEWKRYKVNS